MVFTKFQCFNFYFKGEKSERDRSKSSSRKPKDESEETAKTSKRPKKGSEDVSRQKSDVSTDGQKSKSKSSSKKDEDDDDDTALSRYRLKKKDINTFGLAAFSLALGTF